MLVSSFDLLFGGISELINLLEIVRLILELICFLNELTR